MINTGNSLSYFIVFSNKRSELTQFFKQSYCTISDDQKEDCIWQVWQHPEATFLVLDTTLLEKQQSSWKHFITVLKKQYRHYMFNAVLIVFDANEMQLHINVLQQKIADLAGHYSYSIPVNLIVKHCQRLPGFSLFFSNISKQQRQSVWGVQSYGQANNVHHQLQRLGQRLTQLALLKLNHTENLLEKILIYQFPKHFAELQERLSKALHVKSIYFVGKNKTQDFFSQHVLSTIIKQNNQPAISWRQRILNKRWMKYVFIISSLILIIVFFIYKQKNFQKQSFLYKQQTTLAEQLVINKSEQHFISYDALLAINELYEINRTQIKRKKVANSLKKLLKKAMQHYFVTITSDYLEQQLNHFNELWQAKVDQYQSLRGAYYTVLQTYIALGYPHSNSTLPLLSQYWKSAVQQQFQLQLPIDLLTELIQHYFSDTQQNVTLQHHLIEQARNNLKGGHLLDNSYSKLQYIAELRWGSLSLTQLLEQHDHTVLISQQTLPALYTKKAWEQLVQPILQQLINGNNDDQILNTPLHELNMSTTKNPATLSQRLHAIQSAEILLNRYLDDYQHAWLTFLASIKPVSWFSLAQTSKQLQLLSKQNSNFAHLERLLKKNMQLQLPRTHPLHSFLKLQLNKDESLFKLLQQLEQNASWKEFLNRYHEHLARIAQSIALLINTDDDKQLLDTVKHLLSTTNSNHPLAQAVNETKQFLQSIEVASLRYSLQHILLTPLEMTWHNMLKQSQRLMEQLWHKQVIQPYQQQLQPLFPFQRQGNNASMSDIATFLHPQQGVVWQFVDRHLGPFINIQDIPWQNYRWLEQGLTIKQHTLNTLFQLKKVSHLLCSDNINPLDITLYLEANPQLTEILLLHNQQIIRYNNGPQYWQVLHWPGDHNDQFTLLRITDTQGKQQQLEYVGLWGLLRLLRHAELQQLNATTLRAAWRFPGIKQPIYLRLQSSKLAIWLPLLKQQLQLPKNLFLG